MKAKIVYENSKGKPVIEMECIDSEDWFYAVYKIGVKGKKEKIGTIIKKDMQQWHEHYLDKGYSLKEK